MCLNSCAFLFDTLKNFTYCSYIEWLSLFSELIFTTYKSKYSRTCNYRGFIFNLSSEWLWLRPIYENSGGSSGGAHGPCVLFVVKKSKEAANTMWYCCLRIIFSLYLCLEYREGKHISVRPNSNPPDASFICICFHLQFAFHDLYHSFCFVKFIMNFQILEESIIIKL